MTDIVFSNSAINKIADAGLNGLLQKAGFEKKDHQFDCVRWGVGNELKHGKGGLIADEMGLGKTAQMLGIIVSNPKPITLVVVPLALLNQWTEAVRSMTGTEPIVYHGAKKKTIKSDGLQRDLSRVLHPMHHYASQRKEQPIHSVRFDRVCFDERTI